MSANHNFMDREHLEKQFNYPNGGFDKMRKSAEEFMQAMNEYYVMHPEQYEQEMTVVKGIMDRAKERAEKDNLLACGCKYLRGELCSGQKSMPVCTPNFGYCPFAKNNK
jgi:hypothetical protein